MQYLRALFAGLGLLALAACAADAASVPIMTGPQDPSQLQNSLNTVIGQINSGVPGFGSTFVGKNYLDNSSAAINQRGTAEATGSTTSGCAVTAYVTDRWCIDTNVTSGAGFGQVVTSSPSPPPGFQNSVKVYRKTGALTQPVCFMSEIDTARFTQLQGKPVIFSAYVQGLAGNTATTALTIQLTTGTGTDQGLGANRSAVGMTASPAITPVFTGLASNAFSAAAASPSWNVGTTATWNRIYSAPLAVPATATEGAVEICTTPVGSSSGTTDGFAIVGMMLEQADPSQTAPSAYEFLPPQYDLMRAQRFYYELDESATIFVAGACKAESVTVATCYVQFPQVMQAAPTMSYANGFATETTVAGGTLGACTTLATASTVASTAPNNQGILVGCTAATVPAAGSAGMLYSNNGTGKIKASADF